MHPPHHIVPAPHLQVFAVREALVEMVLSVPSCQLAATPFYSITAALVAVAYLISVLVPSIYVSEALADEIEAGWAPAGRAHGSCRRSCICCCPCLRLASRSVSASMQRRPTPASLALVRRVCLRWWGRQQPSSSRTSSPPWWCSSASPAQPSVQVRARHVGTAEGSRGGGGGPARSLQQVGTKCPDIICSGSAAQQHITACLGLLPNGMRSLVALCMALANPHRSPSHLHGAGAYGLLGLGALMSATAIYNHIIGAELE